MAAQAATQVERARNAVKKQAQQALSAKPKLQLHITLDAPKVAVPIPEAPGGSEGVLRDMQKHAVAACKCKRIRLFLMNHCCVRLEGGASYATALLTMLLYVHPLQGQ